MREEFQGQYVFWNTDEYLDLIRWMRHYNVSHPGRPTLRFVGNDLGYPGPEAFDQVTSYVTAHRPGVAERIAILYAGLRPARSASAGCLDGAAAGQGPRVPPGRGRPCGARPHPPVRVGAAAGLRRPGLRLGRPERHRRRPELHRVCLSRRGVPGADALPGPGHGRQHRLVAGPHELQDPARLQQWPRRLHQRQPAGVSRTGRRVPAQEARQEVRERRPDLQRGQPQRPARLHRSATAEVCRGPRPGRAQRAHPGPGSPSRLRPGPAPPRPGPGSTPPAPPVPTACTGPTRIKRPPWAAPTT